MTTPRDPAEKLAVALAKLGEAGHTLAAQEAMGWAFKGDLPRVRAALTKLPAEKLREASAAADLLSALADELLRDRPAGPDPTK